MAAVTTRILGEGRSAEAFVGVTHHGDFWHAEIKANGKLHELGVFTDGHDAAVAHDMEALRAFGVNAKELNFRYEVLQESSTEQGHMKVRTPDGVELAVDVASDESTYEPILPPCPAPSQSLKVHDNTSIRSGGAPAIPDNTRTWHARNSSLYTPSASFVYDITFPHKKSLGLNLKPHYIYYSPDSEQYIGTLVVVEAMSLLSSLVYPGDIILQINSNNMTAIGKDFNFDQMTSLIMSTTPPRTVKFFRPSGPSHSLSPAEILMFLGMPADPGATDVEHLMTQSRPAHSLARFNVVATGTSQSLQLIYLDNQAPLAIKRLMQGMKVRWEGNPAQTVWEGSKLKEENLKTCTSTQEIIQMFPTSRMSSEGLSQKWIAQLVLPQQSYSNDSNPSASSKTKEENSQNVSTSFGAIATQSSSATSQIKNDLPKRKKVARLPPREEAFKRKAAKRNEYEKVYYLGKYDLEQSAREAVSNARKESAYNGGIYFPHNASSSPRSTVQILSSANTAPTSSTTSSTYHPPSISSNVSTSFPAQRSAPNQASTSSRMPPFKQVSAIQAASSTIKPQQ